MERVAELTRRISGTVVGDRGFGTAANDRVLAERGVKRIGLQRKGRLSAARAALERTRAFRRLRNWLSASRPASAISAANPPRIRSRHVRRAAPAAERAGPAGPAPASPSRSSISTTPTTVAEGDKVAVRWTVEGTQQGELLGIPPTGKPARFSGISIYRLAAGKIAEQWEQWDRLPLLQQLGLLPTPPAPTATTG